MSRTCDLTNSGILYGNKVSHSAIKNKRKFLPNLQSVKLISDCLGQTFYFKISTKTLRTINKYGSLDSFLVNIGFNHLSEKGKTLRKKVMNALMKSGDYEKVKIIKKTISKNIDKAEKKVKNIEDKAI